MAKEINTLKEFLDSEIYSELKRDIKWHDMK